jgi:hypothetical protein
MPRWSLKEQRLLAEIRHRLRDDLAKQPSYIEVVGDRRILRFIRGFKHNIDQATEAYGKMLKFRRENKVDAMREQIVQGGLDHPSLFPRGKRILEMIPHLVIAPNAKDRNGNLICAEGYKFKPADVLEEIGLESYLIFAIYALEYRTIIVEQECERAERAFLASLTPEQRVAALDPYGKSEPHGVILGTLVIRDIGSVTLEHCSEVGRQIIKAIVTVSSDNYPELLKKCYLINVPWVFNAFWYFIKGMLHESTLKKIVICGKDFRQLLDNDLAPEFVPTLIGGPYNGGMVASEPESKVTWDIPFLVEGQSLEAEVRKITDAQGRSNNHLTELTDLERNSLEASLITKGPAKRSPLWWVEKHYLGEYPLWSAALASYTGYFFLSGQWRSILPFTPQIILIWAFLILTM